MASLLVCDVCRIWKVGKLKAVYAADRMYKKTTQGLGIRFICHCN